MMKYVNVGDIIEDCGNLYEVVHIYNITSGVVKELFDNGDLIMNFYWGYPKIVKNTAKIKHDYTVGMGVRANDFRYGIIESINEVNNTIQVIDLSIYEGILMTFKLDEFIESEWKRDDSVIERFRKIRDIKNKESNTRHWEAKYGDCKKELGIGMGEYLQLRIDAFGNLL